MKKFTVLKIFALALVTSFTHAQDPLIPDSVVTSFTFALGTDPINTINGVGMLSFPSLIADHEPTSPVNSFVGMGMTGVLDYLLGGLHTINGFSIWNQNAGGPGALGTTGIQDVTVQSSINGVDYFNIPGGPTVFAQVMTGLSPPEMFSFAPVDAAFIRIVVDNNWGDVNTGYAEIAFSELVLGTTDEQLEAAVSLVPNPAGEQVFIANRSNVDLDKALIYDLNGQLVLEIDLVSTLGQQRVDISSLASGLYIVKITGERGQTAKRLVKQ